MTNQHQTYRRQFHTGSQNSKHQPWHFALGNKENVFRALSSNDAYKRTPFDEAVHSKGLTISIERLEELKAETASNLLEGLDDVGDWDKNCRKAFKKALRACLGHYYALAQLVACNLTNQASCF